MKNNEKNRLSLKYKFLNFKISENFYKIKI